MSGWVELAPGWHRRGIYSAARLHTGRWAARWVGPKLNTISEHDTPEAAREACDTWQPKSKAKPKKGAK